MGRWEAGVAMAAEDAPQDLAAAVREELRFLWDDLSQARRTALSGGWSIRCDTLTARIVTLSRFAGATGWRDIQVDLLQDGIYQGILRSAGIGFEEPDMAEVDAVGARARPGWSGHG